MRIKVISFHSILKSTLFKVGMLSNVSLLIRLLTGVVSAKMIAIFVGPSGMAFLGNFRNFLSSLETITSLGFNQGVVKYIAQNKKDAPKIAQITSSVFLFFLGILLIASILLVVFRARLSTYVFGPDLEFEYLFVVLAIGFPLQVLNGFFLAILNGLQRYSTVIRVNIFGNVLGFVLTIVCLYQWQLYGALMALVIAPAITGIGSYFKIRKDLVIGIKYWDSPVLRSLFSYSVMAIFSGILAPVTLFYIRKHVIETTGVLQAGYWEAMLRISGFYMLFVVTLISVYYLPRFSKARSKILISKLLREYVFKVLPVFALGLGVFYFFRSFFIALLLDTQFLPVGELVGWQLIGDFLKAFSMVYGVLFYAKKLVVPFLIFEALSHAVFYVSSLFFIDSYGVLGVSIAHSVTYMLYALLLVIYFTVYLRKIN